MKPTMDSLAKVNKCWFATRASRIYRECPYGSERGLGKPVAVR